jgi:hypothetical protein
MDCVLATECIAIGYVGKHELLAAAMTKCGAAGPAADAAAAAASSSAADAVASQPWSELIAAVPGPLGRERAAGRGSMPMLGHGLEGAFVLLMPLVGAAGRRHISTSSVHAFTKLAWLCHASSAPSPLSPACQMQSVNGSCCRLRQPGRTATWIRSAAAWMPCEPWALQWGKSLLSKTASWMLCSSGQTRRAKACAAQRRGRQSWWAERLAAPPAPVAGSMARTGACRLCLELWWLRHLWLGTASVDWSIDLQDPCKLRCVALFYQISTLLAAPFDVPVLQIHFLPHCIDTF